MKGRLRDALRRRPVTVAGLSVAAVLVLMLVVGQAWAWARWEVFAARIERASAISAEGMQSTSWSFPFGSRSVSLQVPLRTAEIDAYRGVDTSAMFKASRGLRARYVSHVVSEQSRSEIIGALAAQLRQVRRVRALDDDEYLELMVRAVQSLRHETVERRVRLPAEVVSSGFGVCSEKALLLAALMVHEGYKTGMWVFDSQNHVAVGVGSDAAQFRGSGFAFIETTRNSYIGEYNNKYAASGPIARPPQFIELSDGRSYRAGAQVEYILGVLTATRDSEQNSGRQLTSYIHGRTDQRQAVFEWLMRSAARVSAANPPAFIR